MKTVCTCSRLRHLSFSTSKDMDRQGSLAVTPSPPVPTTPTVIADTITPPDKRKKQLLISYVRAESADYALHLKIKLAELGYSVYLVSAFCKTLSFVSYVCLHYQ